MTASVFKDMTQKIRTFFDNLAAEWDQSTCPQHSERLKTLVHRLNIPLQAKILDVGSGTGVLLPLLAPPEQYQRWVVAIDLAFLMMRAARRRTDCAQRRVLCVQTDVLTPPFRPETFDWVICNSVFPHFLDQQACLHQLAWVLRPGGAFVVCHTQSREAINEFHRSKGGLIGGHELPDMKDMELLFHRAGLHVQIHENTPEYYLITARKQTG
ncbi:MAG TPA: class I SAM-dependent methyltransferase [Candidatus Hydrogenedentes bacterium]|nr:class I SAM-dependent methyltransferase [Candidatus Hydrogenedentota bacterium]